VIVLDTNVISELMRAEPDAGMLSWMERQATAGLLTTTPTEAEIFYGLALPPDERRRETLVAAAQPMVDVDRAGRILPFDTDAALAYAAIAAGRRQSGQPISQINAQVAAIVRSRGAKLATGYAQRA
jgi:predicted nucleic acid-binding protein